MEHKQFYIIAAPLVAWLRQEGFPMPQPPIRFYPDGSLWTDDYSVLRWVHASVIAGRAHREVQGVEQLIHLRLPGAHASCRFRPLAGIGGDWDHAPHYHLLYPGSCTWMGEHELGVLLYPGVLEDAAQTEHNLSHVRTLVRLRRKITPAIAEELAKVVRQWFVDVGSKGVFGEAGVASVSSALRYAGRDAVFELDAQPSGQETLNTLYLALLNWAMVQRRPLVMIDLAPDSTEAVFASDLLVPLG